jgi:hypothetical protein
MGAPIEKAFVIINAVIFALAKRTMLVVSIYAEVVIRVAGSLEAGGLPRYPEREINVIKT